MDIPADASLLFNRSNVIRGDDDVVEPDFADVSSGRIGDVEIGPKEVNVQILTLAPAESFKRFAARSCVEIFSSPCGIVPPNTFTVRSGDELVENPFAFGKVFA